MDLRFALIKILKAICLAKIHSKRFALPKIAEAIRLAVNVIIREIQGDLP